MLSEYFKEDQSASARVYKARGRHEFMIIYTESSGKIIDMEGFKGKSLHYVEDAAENWALGIKK